MTGGELLVAYLRRQAAANAKVVAHIVIARTQEQEDQPDRRRLPVRGAGDGRCA